MAKEISSALGNQDRAKYQLNATKASLGISKSSDFLGDLSKIRKEYEGYITYAQVANDKDFMIAFSAFNVEIQPSFCNTTYRNRCYI